MNRAIITAMLILWNQDQQMFQGAFDALDVYQQDELAGELILSLPYSPEICCLAYDASRAAEAQAKADALTEALAAAEAVVKAEAEAAAKAKAEAVAKAAAKVAAEAKAKADAEYW